MNSLFNRFFRLIADLGHRFPIISFLYGLLIAMLCCLPNKMGDIGYWLITRRIQPEPHYFEIGLYCIFLAYLFMLVFVGLRSLWRRFTYKSRPLGQLNLSRSEKSRIRAKLQKGVGINR